MWECPINCKKYKRSLSYVDILNTERNRLKQECKQLMTHHDCLDSLCQLTEENYQILAVEKNRPFYVVVALSPINLHSWDTLRTLSLYKLPVRDCSQWTCKMDFKLYSNCSAYIIDWHSREENFGYGSILMKSLIRFLRTSGCQSVSGVIMPTDFDHEAKLRHFYTKFGFEITDRPDKRLLHLSLYDKECLSLKKDGHLVCCRNSSHAILESEALLASLEQTPENTKSD